MPSAKHRILAHIQELPALVQPSRKLLFIAPIAAMLSLGVVTALATVPHQHLNDIPVRKIVESLATSPEPIPLEVDAFVRLVRIRSGDSISSIMEQLGAADDEVRNFILSSESGKAAIRGMRAGEPVTATVASNGRILSLDLLMNAGANRYSVIRDGDTIVESIVFCC